MYSLSDITGWQLQSTPARMLLLCAVKLLLIYSDSVSNQSPVCPVLNGPAHLLQIQACGLSIPFTVIYSYHYFTKKSLTVQS